MILRKLNVIVGLLFGKKDVSHRELLLCSNCNDFATQTKIIKIYYEKTL